MKLNDVEFGVKNSLVQSGLFISFICSFFHGGKIDIPASDVSCKWVYNIN